MDIAKLRGLVLQDMRLAASAHEIASSEHNENKITRAI
jgi:hypothetical protein